MTDALEADWLSLSRRAADALRELLQALPTTAERAVVVGQGEGGDRTLVIDAQAEAAVFRELDRLHAEGFRFRVISEERGEVDYGRSGVLVVVDPIDGSLNAKRGISHHAISIAVADGATMGDVVFGYVRDLATGEEFVARRGLGATLDGVALPREPRERRNAAGKLEVLGIESADPRWVEQSASALAGCAHRLRAVGSIAISLCQVAAARFDGMVTLRGCRAVDCAAGQLIVREAGGCVEFVGLSEPLAAPLDLVAHAPLVAARTSAGLAELARVPR
jgi:myo-inositol-1(or 4)-monophosphatase